MGDSSVTEAAVVLSKLDLNSCENELALKEVFKHLHPKELRVARQVCHSWNSPATFALSKWKLSRLIIEGTDAAEAIPSKIKRIKETELVKYKQFPCSEFKFNKIKLRSEAVKNFLRLQGPLITQLELVLRPDTKLSSLIMLLNVQVPNLEYLKLIDVPDWKSLKKVNNLELGPLKKLKTLVFEAIVPKFREKTPAWLVEGFLTAAQNLQEVTYFPLQLVELLEKTGKVQVLKDLYFYVKKIDYEEAKAIGYGDDFDVSYYLTLAKMGPKLRMLDNAFAYKLIEHPDAWTEAETALKMILTSSQDTLEEFCTQAFGFLEAVRIPPLKKVKKLIICVRSDDPAQNGGRNGIRTVFPPGTNLIKSFPVLYDSSITCSSDQPFPSVFPPAMFKQGSFPLVSTLLLDFHAMNSLTGDEWKSFIQAFPNGSTLSVITGLSRVAAQLESIWTYWKQAFVIEIRIRDKACAPKDFKRPSYPFLDEIITGIPEGKCQRLRKEHPTATNAETLKKFIVRDSVLDLKVLKIFALTFESKTLLNLHVTEQPILSRVTYQFCSAMKPQLKFLTMWRP